MAKNTIKENKYKRRKIILIGLSTLCLSLSSTLIASTQIASTKEVEFSTNNNSKNNKDNLYAGVSLDVNEMLENSFNTYVTADIIPKSIETVEAENAENEEKLEALLAMDRIEMVHAMYDDPSLIPSMGVYYDVSVPEYVQDFIHVMEKKTGVPAVVIYAIMGKESEYTLGKISSTGDYGVMQVNKHWTEEKWKKLGWTEDQVLNEWIAGIDVGIDVLIDAMNYYNYTLEDYNMDDLFGYYHSYINWRTADDGPSYVNDCVMRIEVFFSEELKLKLIIKIPF